MNRSEIFIAYIGVPESLSAENVYLFWKSTAKQFNGYTLAPCQGGWVSSSGELIEEPAIRAEIVTNLPYSDIREWAERAAIVYGQEFVLVVRLGALGAELVPHPIEQTA